ncbi:murein transglycosylase D [Moellerella wisconsensis]|uniref:peptidoglycan lytic exotransglycosylase n=1 Tax=Moellerella wisconsensis ATCC 35017 TaxID=1354267 RepID=A0A0N0IB20_9GAMM|nr:murein transglycosylase D [Moellerella wisconsensis]KPD03532.1 membrane-bound lytic murein transglycosylase D [Moellerella wisconsensis ATCC 35017]VFS50976.1 Membrane-bound lytic murein transglycosylase D precursor [Moellerella wisconsensis]
MKTKAILFAIVLLAGCQSPSKHNKQNVSSASHAIETVASHNQAASRQTPLLENDLWGYISDELKMNVPKNERIQEQANNFLSKKDQLQTMTVRAEPYMYWIVDEINDRNLPMELALVPIIESSFNPNATSSAQAAGLWQIVPITARSYGLKQNQWVDDRRNLAASTSAAFDLLENLNVMFGHDWELTLAAYNCGEGCVLNAIKKNEAQGLPTDFWSLSLPKETMLYVPKILALSKILRDKDNYQIRLPRSNKNKALTQVDVGQQITLSQAAELAGLTIESLKTYNSGYKKGITSPDGPHYIMLPANKAERFKLALTDQSVLANIRSAVNKNNQRTQQIQQQAITRYKVQSGDTLSSIAKRYNTHPKKIQQINGLKTASNIKVGQILKITDKQRLENYTKSKSPSSIYKVKRGDSYYSIAKRHGIKLKDLMNWNSGVKMADLKPGVTLSLYL